MANERSGSKTDVVIKLILVFFISLLSFSIGTFVGKKFSDNQHKLAQFEPTSKSHGDATDTEETSHSGGRNVAAIQNEHGDVAPHKPLNDEEIAKLAEEFVADDEGKHNSGHEAEGVKTDKNSEHHTEAKATDAHGANDHSKNKSKKSEHSATSAKTTDVEPLSKATQVAKVEDRLHADPHGRIPSSTAGSNEKKMALPQDLIPSAAGKFTVQVASYTTENEAEKMAAGLKEKGFSAFYVASKIVNKQTSEPKTYYRVNLGLFAKKEEAEKYLTDLKSRGKIESGFVQKISN